MSVLHRWADFFQDEQDERSGSRGGLGGVTSTICSTFGSCRPGNAQRILTRCRVCGRRWLTDISVVTNADAQSLHLRERTNSFACRSTMNYGGATGSV